MNLFGDNFDIKMESDQSKKNSANGGLRDMFMEEEKEINSTRLEICLIC